MKSTFSPSAGEVSSGVMARVRSTVRHALAATLCSAVLSPPAFAASDTVTIVVPEAIVNLDPCNATHSHVGRVLKQNIVETLVELDPMVGGVMPKLATSWEKLDDKTWRFVLRPGVKFHDGSDFNAAAVEQSIARTLNPALECSTRQKFFGAVKITTKVVDDHTIDIVTEPPQPILPTLLSTLAIASPKTNPTGPERSPIGTGPYAFGSWTQGDELVMNQFDGYWGDKPEFKTAKFVYRSESAVAAAMVAAGEADLAPYIAVQDANNPETDVAYLNTETVHLVMSNDQVPLNDVRIRKAMNYAIDRQSFIGSIMSDQVQLASQLVLPFINGYNPDIKPWPYDPEQAKKLIAEAKADGVDVNAEFALFASTGLMANQADMMSAIAEMWRAVGLNVRVQAIDKAQLVEFLSRPHAPNRRPGAIINDHDNKTGDASFTLYFKYHSKGGQSEANDAELDSLIEQGQVASGEARTELFQRAFKRISEEVVPDALMFHLVGFARVGPTVEFKPNSVTNTELHVSAIHPKQ